MKRQAEVDAEAEELHGAWERSWTLWMCRTFGLESGFQGKSRAGKAGKAVCLGLEPPSFQ